MYLFLTEAFEKIVWVGGIFDSTEFSVCNFIFCNWYSQDQNHACIIQNLNPVDLDFGLLETNEICFLWQFFIRSTSFWNMWKVTIILLLNNFVAQIFLTGPILLYDVSKFCSSPPCKNPGSAPETLGCFGMPFRGKNTYQVVVLVLTSQRGCLRKGATPAEHFLTSVIKQHKKYHFLPPFIILRFQNKVDKFTFFMKGSRVPRTGRGFGPSIPWALKYP